MGKEPDIQTQEARLMVQFCLSGWQGSHMLIKGQAEYGAALGKSEEK